MPCCDEAIRIHLLRINYSTGYLLLAGALASKVATG
jgi:hypothetical protein